jgi:hypothetical protein
MLLVREVVKYGDLSTAALRAFGRDDRVWE